MEINDDVTNSDIEKESKDSRRRVKAPSKGKIVGRIIPFSIVGGYLLFLSLIVFLDTAIFKSKHAKQEELTNTEGIIESVEVYGHEYGTDMEIKLKDNEKTFHMSPMAYEACDKSIETDDLNGLFVYMSVAGSSESSVYSLKTDGKIYLTFDGYLNAHIKYLAWRYGFSSASFLIGSGFMVLTFLSVKQLKKISKKKA